MTWPTKISDSGSRSLHELGDAGRSMARMPSGSPTPPLEPKGAGASSTQAIPGLGVAELQMLEQLIARANPLLVAAGGDQLHLDPRCFPQLQVWFSRAAHSISALLFVPHSEKPRFSRVQKSSEPQFYVFQILGLLYLCTRRVLPAHF